MIVVDTSVWIDFFAGRETSQVAHLLLCIDDGEEEVALTDLILTEILQGLRTDHEVQRVDERLSVFEVLRLCIREQVPLLHADTDFDHLARVTELAVVTAA